MMLRRNHLAVFVTKSHKSLYPTFRGLFPPDDGVDILHGLLKKFQFLKLLLQFFQRIGVIAGDTSAPIVEILLIPVAVHGFSPLFFASRAAKHFPRSGGGIRLLPMPPTRRRKWTIPVGPWPYRQAFHPQGWAFRAILEWKGLLP
jgi:hypothetical protein